MQLVNGSAYGTSGGGGGRFDLFGNMSMGEMAGGGANVLGSGLDTYSKAMGYKSAAAQYASGKRSAKQAASLAKKRGKYEAWRQKIAAGRWAGQARAALGASGVEVNEDTSIEVLAEGMKELALDNWMILDNAKSEARGYLRQAEDFAEAERITKKAGRTSTAIGIARTGMSAAGLLFGV